VWKKEDFNHRGTHYLKIRRFLPQKFGSIKANLPELCAGNISAQ
jgi:hypothetical protein